MSLEPAGAGGLRGALLRPKAATNPDVERASQLIDRQVKVMGRLIDDLMDVSRISQGKIELQRQRVTMAEVLNDAIEAVRPVIDEARLHPGTSTSPSTERWRCTPMPPGCRRLS